MNSYEIKQQQKKERYQELAEKKSATAEQLYERAHVMGKVIPFGQPILIGHHSERADRSYRAKVNRTFEKSFEEGKKAEYYAAKAERIGTGGISSDDPEAVEKLKIKLAKLEDRQKDMKEINAEARANKTEKPYPTWQLSNNNAVIRNVKLRIKQLSAAQEMEANPDEVGYGWTLHEDAEENRIQFLFQSIPAENVRKELKSRGFRWSPTNTAWQRQLNQNGRRAASSIQMYLKGLQKITN